MKIYGWNADKDIIEVDLPPPVVASLMIDPRKTDLFERNPIELDVSAQTIFFTPLKELSFAYTILDRLYMGTYVDGTAACFSGHCQFDTIPRSHQLPTGLSSLFTLDLLHSRQEDFTKHWTLCLRHLAPARVNGMTLNRLNDWKLAHLKSGFLYFDLDHTDWGTHEFTGKMFEEISFHHFLPDSLNWLLEKFKGTTIIGESVRRALLGEPIHQIIATLPRAGIAHSKLLESGDVVNLSVKRQTVDTLSDGLQDSVVCFERNGVEYLLVSEIRCPKGAQPQHMNREYSIDWLRAEAPDSVVATRIALYDLARGKYRRILEQQCARSGRQRRSIGTEMPALPLTPGPPPN